MGGAVRSGGIERIREPVASAAPASERSEQKDRRSGDWDAGEAPELGGAEDSPAAKRGSVRRADTGAEHDRRDFEAQRTDGEPEAATGGAAEKRTAGACRRAQRGVVRRLQRLV